MGEIVTQTVKVGDQNVEMAIEFDTDGSAGAVRTYKYDLARGTSPVEAFEMATSLIRASAEKIATSVQSVAEAVRPKEFSVEFGVKLDAEIGAFIVKSGIESQFKVTLKWIN